MQLLPSQAWRIHPWAGFINVIGWQSLRLSASTFPSRRKQRTSSRMSLSRGRAERGSQQFETHHQREIANRKVSTYASRTVRYTTYIAGQTTTQAPAHFYAGCLAAGRCRIGRQRRMGLRCYTLIAAGPHDGWSRQNTARLAELNLKDGTSRGLPAAERSWLERDLWGGLSAGYLSEPEALQWRDTDPQGSLRRPCPHCYLVRRYACEQVHLHR